MPDPQIADQFSDEEMNQMKRYGQAQLGGEQFSDQVEKELGKFHARREANAGKMKAAQTSSSPMGPTEFQTQQADQTNKLQQQSDTQGDVKAAQAQGQSAPLTPPAAPGGAAGVTAPYPAQAGPQPPAPAEPPPPMPTGQNGQGGAGPEDDSEPS